VALGDKIVESLGNYEKKVLGTARTETLQWKSIVTDSPVGLTNKSVYCHDSSTSFICDVISHFNKL